MKPFPWAEDEKWTDQVSGWLPEGVFDQILVALRSRRIECCYEDDLVWLEDAAEAVGSSKDEILGLIKTALVHNYSGLLTFHMTRRFLHTSDIWKPLKPLDREYVLDRVRAFCTSTGENFDERQVDQQLEAINWSVRHGRIYTIANREYAISNASHYGIYGSECVLCVLQNIYGRLKAQKFLKNEGSSALLYHLNIPWLSLDDRLIEAIVSNIVSLAFERKLSVGTFWGNQDHECSWAFRAEIGAGCITSIEVLSVLYDQIGERTMIDCR